MRGPLAIVAAVPVMDKYWMPVAVAMTVPFSGGFVGALQAEVASARSKRVSMETELSFCDGCTTTIGKQMNHPCTT